MLSFDFDTMNEKWNKEEGGSFKALYNERILLNMKRATLCQCRNSM
mgnify:CR=1 FL=1